MDRFYEPFEGTDYRAGVRGKKVLVVGASFYCPLKECPYYSDCTDPVKRDSSAYDITCPECLKHNVVLRDEPTNEIKDGVSISYANFMKYFSRFCNSNDYMDCWNQVAFTNYVQFEVPPTRTYKSYLSDRDFRAFNETLVQLQPDIVIIWGCVINSRLKEKNEYLVDNNELINTDYYVCHLRVPGVTHDIALINPFHPSSSMWGEKSAEFEKYLSQLLL